MRKVALAAVAALMLCGTADAAVINLTYSGIDSGGDPSYTSMGSGSFSTGVTGAVSLADLTAFSFTQTVTDSTGPVSGTFEYDLTDLVSFSAILSGGTITSLQFKTTTAPDPAGFFYDESVEVTSLGADGTSTYNPVGARLQIGATVQAQAAVPEPASWAMFIGGFGLVGGAMRRRKVAVSFG